MSEEGAHGTNNANLRDFRIHKQKQVLSHQQFQTGKCSISSVFLCSVQSIERSFVGPRKFQRIRVNLTSESESDNENNSKTIPMSNGSRQLKDPAVLEKERQMHFLLECFPRANPMVSFRLFIIIHRIKCLIYSCGNT